MTLLIDAAPLVALADSGEPRRDAVLDVLSDEPGALVIPAPTTAEIDYMLGERFGGVARRAFLDDLARGRFTVAALERKEYARIVDLEAFSGSVSPTARWSCSPHGTAPPGS